MKYKLFSHFHTRFSSVGGRGGSSPRRSQNTLRFSATSVATLAQHQDRTKPGWKCNHTVL